MNPVEGLRNWLIGITVISGALLTICAMPLMMSVMVFDSGVTPQAWAVFITIWLVPLAIIAGLVFAWAGYIRRSRATTIVGFVVAGIPLLLMGGFAGYIALGLA